MAKRLATTLITDVVKEYVAAQDTAHAIMLDGEWGCGKTFLWKRTIAPAVGVNKCLYVSLYGLKTHEEIDDAVFRELTSIGQEEGSLLTDILNKTSADVGDFRLGGIGHLVSYALKRWRKYVKDQNADMALLCFDDLERWSGDAEIVLSYLNRLCEREGQKVLVIGYYRAFMERGANAVGTSGFRKTIRFKYKMLIPAEEVLRIAQDTCSGLPDDASNYLASLLQLNGQRLSSFVMRFKIFNLRTVATSVHYFLSTQQANKALFLKATLPALSFFESLLATMVLLSAEDERRDLRDMLEDPRLEDHARLLEGYNGLQSELGKSEFEELVRCAVYSQARRGITSLVSHGTYLAEDFRSVFQQWETLDAYYYSYIDEAHFYSLLPSDGAEIARKVVEGVLIRNEVVDASLLLRILDRLLQDIDEKAITEDKQKLLESFDKLMEQLISSAKLEPGDTSVTVAMMNIPKEFISDLDRRLEKYDVQLREREATQFWEELPSRSGAGEVTALVADNREHPLLTAPLQTVMATLEALPNPELAALVLALADRRDAKSASQARLAEVEGATRVSEALRSKYRSQVGLREANLRKLSALLENYA